MAVLMTAEVKGLPPMAYASMLAQLGEHLKQAPGFVLHAAYFVEGGWRVWEVWESVAAADDFFIRYVQPNLPPGLAPQRVFQELIGLVKA